MSIIDNIRQMFGRDNSEKISSPVDIDDDGKTLFKEDIIAFVAEKLAERKKERVGFELQWTLNANFLAGNQLRLHRLSTRVVQTLKKSTTQ